MARTQYTDPKAEEAFNANQVANKQEFLSPGELASRQRSKKDKGRLGLLLESVYGS